MADETGRGPHREGMLGPYRVLDLSDERGILCGKILADLGADVIQIEPPGGSPARRIGPFYRDAPGPDSSLFWWSYAANKRSITLNLRTLDGRALLKRLLPTADFLVESSPPGELAALGLGYADLAAINPALIVVSITPFGQSGPYASFQAPDLVGIGMARPDVRDRRPRPRAGARGLSAFLPARRRRRRHRGDAGARPPYPHRRRAAR